MTHEEHDDILEIARNHTWDFRAVLLKYMETVEVGEKTPEKGQNDANKGMSVRTSAQNRSIHKWFNDISDACVNEGVEASAVFAKTHNIQMTPEAVKAMWKALQLALFGKKSTTELKKSGEIDKLQDHFIRFFAENFELELPPFPVDEKKHLGGIKIEQTKEREYPKYEGEVKF